MATEVIEIADALNAVLFDFGHRPAGKPSVAFPACTSVEFLFGHRPAYDFVVDPSPPPAVVEHFIMNAQRVDGTHVTWVTAGSPDPSGASAPGGSPLVAASILLVKRGLFY